MAYSTKRLNKRKVSSDPVVRRRVKLRSNNMCAAWRLYKLNKKYIKCRSRYKLKIDHMREIRWGGFDIEINLQALCKTCHERKTYLNRKYQNTWTYISFE
jgi:hypothetical protein